MNELLLPELWRNEIIGEHLCAYRMRTRVALRLVSRWFYANVPPPDPATDELYTAAWRVELRALTKLNGPPASLLRWKVFILDKEAVSAYWLAMRSCLKRRRFDLFEVMWHAFGNNKKILLTVRADSTRLRLGSGLGYALASNDVDTLKSYIAFMHRELFYPDTAVELQPYIAHLDRIIHALGQGYYKTTAYLLEQIHRLKRIPTSDRWARLLAVCRKSEQCFTVVVTHLLPKLPFFTAEINEEELSRIALVVGWPWPSERIGQ